MPCIFLNIHSQKDLLGFDRLGIWLLRIDLMKLCVQHPHMVWLLIPSNVGILMCYDLPSCISCTILVLDLAEV